MSIVPPVATETPEFDTERRTELVEILDIISSRISWLNLAFWGVDWLYAPDLVWIFLAIRLAVIGFSVLTAAQARRAALNKVVEGWAVALVAVYGLQMTMMMALTEGVASPYYAGLNLVCLASVCFMPARKPLIFYTMSATYVPYFILAVNNCMRHPERVRPFLISLAFIISMAVMSVIIAFFRERLQRVEFSHRVRLAQDLAKREEERAREAAVARMSQMVAHDVRKPFSLLKVGLQMLSRTKEPDRIQQLIARLTPEIERAVLKVNGLLADVLEIGSSSSSLNCEAVAPETMIEATLEDAVRCYPDCKVALTYDFAHSHLPFVDAGKMQRVYSNIVFNALQAMKFQGQMWFHTAERDGFVEFCIGNSGSLIDAASLPNVFEEFFTKGKKGGTGLGLAIAKKVVGAHGGRIWCASAATAEHPEGKVEFFFTLPVAANVPRGAPVPMPAHLQSLKKTLLLFDDASALSKTAPEGRAVEAEIAQVLALVGRPLRVLLADDEAMYRDALAEFLTQAPVASGAVEIFHADRADQALAITAQQNVDLIISDIDMGEGSPNGFELVRAIRERRENAALACLHSNRIVASDFADADAAGADAFFPKPMARAQLLRLVLLAGQVAAYRRREA